MEHDLKPVLIKKVNLFMHLYYLFNNTHLDKIN